jgi:hypothetical protein
MNKYKILDCFGIERVVLLSGTDFDSLKKKFPLLDDDVISRIKINPLLLGMTGRFMQYIELDGKPLVYDVQASIKIELQLRDLTIVDINLKYFFIDRNREVTVIHLHDEIYSKTGYVIDINKVEPGKHGLYAKELDISGKFKSARNV